MAEEKKYLIDFSKVELGDILLIISDRGISQAMNRFTGCPYHHAMLIVAHWSYIHSAMNGVQAGNPGYLIFEKPDDVILLRLRERDHRIVHMATNAVRRKIGMAYSTDEMRQCNRATEDMNALEANRQFCTRLVAQAFANVGIKLVPNPDYCSPQDLRTSPLVEVIGDVLKEGNEEQLEAARKGSVHLDKQEEIHSDILRQARQITGTDIQSLDQLELHILQHRDSDGPLSEVIERSGYLDLWKDEMHNNSMLYNVEDFMAYFPEEDWVEIANAYLESADENIYSYIQAELSMEDSYAGTGLRYYQLHEEICGNLVRMSMAMKQTMEEVERRVDGESKKTHT